MDKLNISIKIITSVNKKKYCYWLPSS